ncbi:MAG: hypothetical protein IJ485_05240 [Lachnospiraceae bacterium]|nr:hypothetical protein [Lachnospiraceae bacterium]
MRRWNKVVAAMMVCMTIALTGCAGEMPDLTEEENAMVAEYAAGLLLKYDKNYMNALPSEKQLAEIEAVVEEIEADAEEQTAEIEESVAEDATVSDNGVLTEETAETVEEKEITNIGIFLGLDGINIDYAGYELATSYMEGESVAFSLDATPGNQLLIVKFDMTNTDSVDKDVDVLNSGTKFRLIRNGGARQTALYTMLLNDLSIYKDTVLAGSTQQVVLICEVPESEADIETLSLYMANGSDAATIMLE